MYTSWSRNGGRNNEPNNAWGAGENCVHMWGTNGSGSIGSWNDYPSSTSQAYIIEYGGMPNDTPIDDITSADSSTVEIKLDPTGKTITTNIPNITVGDDITITDTANGKPLDNVKHTYYKKDEGGNWIEIPEEPTHPGEYKVKSELPGYTGDEVTFTIRPIKLKIEDKEYTKVYDGKTDYTGSLSLSQDGMLEGRKDVKVTFTQADFNDKNVENANKIHVSGITLSGSDAIDYTIDGITNGELDVDGTITPRPLNISAVYDVSRWAVGIPLPYAYKHNVIEYVEGISAKSKAKSSRASDNMLTYGDTIADTLGDPEYKCVDGSNELDLASPEEGVYTLSVKFTNVSEAAKHNYDIKYYTFDIVIKEKHAPIISPSPDVPEDIPGGEATNDPNPETITEITNPDGTVHTIVKDKIVVRPKKNTVLSKDQIEEWAKKQYKITSALEDDELVFSEIDIKKGNKSIDEIDLSKAKTKYYISFEITDSLNNTTSVLVEYYVSDWLSTAVDTDGDGVPDKDVPRTGDSSNLGIYVLLMMAALAEMVVIYLEKRHE